MLNYALAKARQHVSGGRVRVYAVATNKQGHIVAEAGNSYCITHPMQYRMAKRVGLDSKCFLHAEISCLVVCMRKRVVPHKLYIARVRRDGSAAPSSPCIICANALSLSGIDMKNIITT